MKTTEEQILLADDVINNGGAILGCITFVDENYDDYNSLKDTYSVEPEIAVFCIVNSVTGVIHTSKKYNLEEQCERALYNAESYLIPSHYEGKIIVDIN